MANNLKELLTHLVPHAKQDTNSETDVQTYLTAIRHRIGEETFDAAAEDLKVAVQLALTKAVDANCEPGTDGALDN